MRRASGSSLAEFGGEAGRFGECEPEEYISFYSRGVCADASTPFILPPSTTIHLGTMRINGSSIPRLISFRSYSSTGIDASHSFRHANCTISRCAARPSLRVKTPIPTLLVTSRRGAKTKTKVNLKDLPQGALKLEPYLDTVDDAPRYPPVVQGHRNNMQKFKNCVVLTRVGGFYEVRISMPARPRYYNKVKRTIVNQVPD